jgi:hypothetical protein
MQYRNVAGRGKVSISAHILGYKHEHLVLNREGNQAREEKFTQL